MHRFFSRLTHATSVALIIASALIAICETARTQEAVPVAKPVPPISQVEHVLIISIDGLRPDRMLLANTPVLHELLKGGTYTMWARTTAVAITLPSHTSMLTGVTPRKHAIEWNRDLPLSEPVYPRVPTIFEIAGKAGYSTAMIAGKSKFRTLNKPGTITYVALPEGFEDKSTEPKGSNNQVVADATPIIEKHKPALIFVHFPDVDGTGHKYGWGSPEQLAAIERTDAGVGKILTALEHADIRKNTIVIISSDHGGAGLSHGNVGPDDARSRHIPWIINGPGVRAGFDLTQIEPLQVNTEDTAATVLWLLGLRQPAYLDGKPILQAFADAK